jgi:hypothetical protein
MVSPRNEYVHIAHSKNENQGLTGTNQHHGCTRKECTPCYSPYPCKPAMFTPSTGKGVEAGTNEKLEMERNQLVQFLQYLENTAHNSL